MTLENLCAIADKCIQCPLHENRTNGVFGEGNADSRIMLIGEAPGRMEDETGRPFIGMAGKLLSEIIESAEMDRSEIYITSIVKCRPPENRKPKKPEYSKCMEMYLHKQIELINPDIIGLLGNSATNALIGKTSIKQIHGETYERDGRRYMVLFHPAAALYSRKLLPQLKEDMLALKKFIEP